MADRPPQYSDPQQTQSRYTSNQDEAQDARNAETDLDEPEALPLIPRANTELPGYAQATDPEQQPPAYEEEPKSNGSPLSMHNRRKVQILAALAVTILVIGTIIGIVRTQQLRHQARVHAAQITAIPIQSVPSGVSQKPGTAKPTDPPSLYPNTIQNNRVANPSFQSIDGSTIFDWKMSTPNCWESRGIEKYFSGNGTYARTKYRDPTGCKMQTRVSGYIGFEENSTVWWVTMQYFAPSSNMNSSVTNNSAVDNGLAVVVKSGKQDILLLNTTVASVDQSKNFTTASWLVGISVQPFNISIEAWSKTGWWDVTNVQAVALPPGNM